MAIEICKGQSVRILLKDAKRYLDKHKRLDVAIDTYFNDSGSRRNDSSASTSKLTSLFEKYKDADADIISTQGTLQFFSDLGFNQEEDQMEDGQDDTPKLLSLAYELQSPHLGEWTRKGWLDGWKSIGCDTMDGMKTALARLETKLGSDPSYFRTIYNYTFTFARLEGQRSLRKDNALDYWKSLLNFGVGKDALKHVPVDDDQDIDMDQGQGQGWTSDHTEMWLEYMRGKDAVAVSKDTWQMLPDFIRSFDGDFDKHDAQGNAMCASLHSMRLTGATSSQLLGPPLLTNSSSGQRKGFEPCSIVLLSLYLVYLVPACRSPSFLQ
ncbi:Cullin binding-domain-containing protein [Chiua virens]|nr:Cullin binding-domain-containing protein [Chiua virens]KAG9311125.1 Cullin binding-domain-containing protein [Chiua virens]